MNIRIRRAEPKDGTAVIRLLVQIGALHHEGRPDLFRDDARKYNQAEFEEKLLNENEPVLVAVDDNDEVLGYMFGQINERKDHPVMKDARMLYIDDLCVDEKIRGGGIGKKLMDGACELAKELNCTKIFLNVWEFNENARKFYEKYGMTTFRRYMELDL